eukprot:5658626-Prymnesium_polylepis.1
MNEALSNALMLKQSFTQRELEGFNIPNLMKDSFVKVGNKYFKSASSSQVGDTAISEDVRRVHFDIHELDAVGDHGDTDPRVATILVEDKKTFGLTWMESK